MLKAQLREFIKKSDDVNLKQVMTYPPDDGLRSGELFVAQGYFFLGFGHPDVFLV